MKIKDLILKTEKIDWQNIKDLQPVNLKNNYHSDKTKNSIIKNGFARAIYVWQDSKGDIYTVDGHLRADILRELKNDGYDIPDQLNCTFLDLPNKKTAIKYLLQVFNQKTNPINQENMEIWLDDNEIVLEDMEIELDELHIELNDELEEEEEQEEVKEDEVPEVKHNFVVKGDLFELIDEEQGLSHRVLCGDSTMIDNVDKVMNGEKADMVFTDPPYYRVKGDFDFNFKDFADYKATLSIIYSNINCFIKENSSIYICLWYKYMFDVFNALKDSLTPCEYKNLIIWDNTRHRNTTKQYSNAYEPIMFFTKGSAIFDDSKHLLPYEDESNYKRYNKKGKNVSDIIKIPNIRRNEEEAADHPTQKPIKLVSKFIDISSKKNSLVIDFFLGSGSTLIACQQTKRKCYGIELDEHYCGVIITRWKNYMEKEGKKYSIKRNGEQFTLENGSSNII